MYFFIPLSVLLFHDPFILKRYESEKLSHLSERFLLDSFNFNQSQGSVEQLLKINSF